MQKFQIKICLFVLTTIVFTGCTSPFPTSKKASSSTIAAPIVSTPITTSTTTPRTITPAPASEPESTPTQTPIPTQTLTTTNVNLTTDNEVKDILNGIIPKAVAIYGTFNVNGAFKSVVTKTIPGEKDYCLVTDIRQQNGKSPVDMGNVKSIADLKKVVEDVFTKDIAQKVFYSRYMTPDKDRHLYKDYEGQLYVDTRNGGHGWATKFLIDTAKVKSQKDNVVDIELKSTVFDKPYGTLIIKMEHINGMWLMASGLDDYESIINGTVK
jgi:hypothetical protein